MATRRAFLLNLDADLELAAPGGYTPSRAILSAMERHARVVAETLVPAGDLAIALDTPSGSLTGYRGLAWSPTEGARARLAALGTTPSAAPSLDVLRAVARRDFAYLDELPGSAVYTCADDALAHLARPARLGDGYRLKRVHGMSGRGHRVMRGAIGPSDEAFVRASAPALIIEPNVHILRELALHGFLRSDGALARGDVCESVSDMRGAFVSSRVLDLDTLPTALVARLHAALDEAAAALSGAGYFGPFGIDAFVYDDAGTEAFRARSETNARYSMGWGMGFRSWGAARPDLAEDT